MRRIPVVVVFAAVALSAVGSGHYYIAKRLVLDPGIGDPWRGPLLAAVAGLLLLLFLAPIGERLLPRPLASLVAWPAGVWMGLSFLLIVGLGATDLLWGLMGAAALAAPAGAGATADAAGVRALAVVGFAGLAGLVALRDGLRQPELRRLDVRVDRWPRALDGFRIVQISDLHIGPLLGRRFARRLVERVNALDPDLVALTGDLVDGPVRQLAEEVAPFAELRARHGVFFVTGNHDHYSGVSGWVRRVRGLGMRVLRNERVAIGGDADGFDLAGVDDHRGDLMGGEGGEDLERALRGRAPDRPLVLLAHDPSTFKRASRMGVDLQLSGHTHGGQIWPFGYLVRLVIPFVAGLYRRGTAQLYVSRGTGFWGPPMRLLAPAEITEIALRCGAEA